MADPDWVFVERLHGRMRRVTFFDENFEVITTHDRGIASGDTESDECVLMRAVTLEENLLRSA
jgi:hypothetical protein